MLSRRSKLPSGFGSGFATPGEAERAFRGAVKRTRAQARNTDEPAQGVQLVGQAMLSGDYRRLRAHWLRKARGWGPGKWPEKLPTNKLALFLVPVEPGTPLRGSGWLRPMCMPGFGHFELQLGPETALAVTATVWLETVAPDLFPAVELAPPILERYAASRLDGRAIVDYGAEYPLPRAAV